MPIPASFKVDFSPQRKDLVAQALSRLLTQHYDKCVLRQFVVAIMEEVQELYDALIDLQERRTLYMAEDENLNGLGRIVGEARTPYQYDENRWLFTDRINQRVDSANVWCSGAPFASFVPVGDPQYQINILARIIKNHTLVASVPELERLAHLVTDTWVSWEKTGPMQVAIVVPSTISATAYGMLLRTVTDNRVDEAYMLPYPATLSFSSVVTYVPDKFFCADRARQQCDAARCAIRVPTNSATI